MPAVGAWGGHVVDIAAVMQWTRGQPLPMGRIVPDETLHFWIMAIAPGAAGGRIIAVCFNSDVDPGLPWAFQPTQHANAVVGAAGGLRE